MKTLFIFTVLSLFICNSVFSQNNKSAEGQAVKSAQDKDRNEDQDSMSAADKELLELMKKRMRISEKMLEDMLKGGLFKDFEKKFEKMMDDFDDEHLDSFFDDEDFNTILRGFNPHRGLEEGDYRWMDTPKERILILKLGDIKDNELKIDIKDGAVTVSGTITKKVENRTQHGTSTSVSTSSFKKQFLVPRDADSTRPEIENKEGEVLIRFPKKKFSQNIKNKSGNKSKKSKKSREKKNRVPVPPSRDDKVI